MEYSPKAALHLAELSLLVYKSKFLIQEHMKALTNTWMFISNEETKVLLLEMPEFNIVVFTGTELHDWRDFKTDLDFDFSKGSYGKVHDGFLKSLGNVWDTVLNFVDANDLPIIFSGHSSGGSLALMGALRLSERTQAVYTFGQPRTGNAKFARAVDMFLYGRYFRIKGILDFVPTIPFAFLGYKHAGKKIKMKPERSAWFDENRGHAMWKYYNMAKKAAEK